MNSNNGIEHLYTSIDPTGMSIYYYSKDKPRTTNRTTFKAGHSDNYRMGTLSRNAQKKLKRAINTLVLVSNYKTVYEAATGRRFRFKLNFITLTLPTKTTLTDNEVKGKILGEFLRKWRKRSPGLLYIWKAEVQDNNNIHFHLTTNKFIHYKKLKQRWNRELEKHGIKHPTLGVEANSTDVHAVKNVKNIAAYLATYMGKKDLYKKPLKRWHKRYQKQLADRGRTEVKLPKNYFKNIKRQISGRKWDCSKSLANAVLRLQLLDATTDKRFDQYINTIQPTFQDDYIAFWGLKGEGLKIFPKIYNEWRNLLKAAINEELKNASQTQKVNII